MKLLNKNFELNEIKLNQLIKLYFRKLKKYNFYQKMKLSKNYFNNKFSNEIKNLKNIINILFNIIELNSHLIENEELIEMISLYQYYFEENLYFNIDNIK